MSDVDRIAKLEQSVASLSSRLQRREDELDVRKLQYLYGYLIDKCLYNETVDLFTDDGEVRFFGGIWRGKEGIRRLYVERFQKRFTHGTNGPIDGFLLDHPQLFANLGFEALANTISHPDEEARRLVNKYAVEMSYIAHQLGRVQSFLTVPTMETDGHELMDKDSFELFKKIIEHYAPEISRVLTMDNLPEYREQLNKSIPIDLISSLN